VAVDSSNNVYVTGYFNGAAAFGTNTLNSFGSDDIFIAKYDGNGNLTWATQAGGTADDKAYSISADAGGNCYFTGYIRDTVAFDTQIINSIKPREADIFIANYNANGTVQLSQVWVGKQVTSIAASAIAEDATKNKYLGGAIYGVAFLGNDTLTSDYSSSLYLVKYDSGGNLIWVKQTGTGGPGAAILIGA
ncbi:MAG: hypothetical protein AAB221_15515, partial [Bacteroidota bacterium]